MGRGERFRVRERPAPERVLGRPLPAGLASDDGYVVVPMRAEDIPSIEESFPPASRYVLAGWLDDGGEFHPDNPTNRVCLTYRYDWEPLHRKVAQ